MDENSFHKAIERSYPACLRFAKSLTRNADLAGDVVQEAVLAALTCANRPEDSDQVQSWLMGFVKNRALNAGRALGADRRNGDGLKAVVEVFGLDTAPRPDERLHALELLEGLTSEDRLAAVTAVTGSCVNAKERWTECLASEDTRANLLKHNAALTESQRAAVQAMVVDGLGFKLAASRLGISPKSVRQRIVSAVQRASAIEKGKPVRTLRTGLSMLEKFLTDTMRERLVQNIALLSAPQQEAVQLIIVERRTLKSTAKALNKTVPTLRDRIFSAIRALGEDVPNKRREYPNRRKPRSSVKVGGRRRPTPECWPILKRGTLGAFTPANSNSTHRHTQAAE